MKKELDISWLMAQADSGESRERLAQILERRDAVYEANRFWEGNEPFSLCLANRTLAFRENSAFSSIEVYHEIFKEDNHCLSAGFDGRDARVLVDIGANEGYYGLKINRCNPGCKLVMVEPNPHVYRRLAENCRVNGSGTILTLNRAIGDYNGTLTLEIIEEIGAIGSKNLRMVERPWLKDEFVKKIAVPVITLAQLFDDCQLSHVDILKIDAEGMEMAILAGGKGILNRVRRIVVERHSRELRDNVLAFLTRNHFRLVYEEDPTFKNYYGDLYFIADGDV